MNPELLFQQNLEKHIGKRLKLRINDNRSTMLSVKWERGCTKVSIHRFFLKAPKNIMDELACYIRRDTKQITPSVKAFIEKNTKKLDYSQKLDKEKLETAGRVYDLKKIYQRVNRRYFENELDLHITWFGSQQLRSRSRITFGLYDHSLKLVKINRCLDRKTVPEYLIEFVVYHEMLHAVCPTRYNLRSGRNQIHTPEFVLREKEFKEYHQAVEWIKHYKNRFFRRID